MKGPLAVSLAVQTFSPKGPTGPLGPLENDEHQVVMMYLDGR